MKNIYFTILISILHLNAYSQSKKELKMIVENMKQDSIKSQNEIIQLINQINKKEYDALVDLNQNYDRVISLVCLKINIPIKVGFQSPLADNLYTLVVQPEENGLLEKKYKLIETLLNINQDI